MSLPEPPPPSFPEVPGVIVTPLLFSTVIIGFIGLLALRRPAFRFAFYLTVMLTLVGFALGYALSYMGLAMTGAFIGTIVAVIISTLRRVKLRLSKT
jgi:hypothetical protein